MLYFQDDIPYTRHMQTSKTYSAMPYGFTSRLITIEGDAAQGLPNFNIIGMPSRTIDESRDRIRSAIRNSGFNFPKHKIIINLAPAELNKSGSSLDLPIAIAILTLSNQLLQRDLKSTLFAGELALDGEIKPVKGIISIIECAKRLHIKRVIIPTKNSPQAELVANNINIYPVNNLREL